MQRFTNIAMFALLTATFGFTASVQAQEKDVTKAAAKTVIKSVQKGELIGLYFKPGGIVDGKFMNNPRYAVFGPKLTLVSATLDGKKLRVEFSVDEDGQGVQLLNLDNGVAKVGHKPAGEKEFAETKITGADQTENYDKGNLVFVFDDYTALHKAVPKKK